MNFWYFLGLKTEKRVFIQIKQKQKYNFYSFTCQNIEAFCLNITYWIHELYKNSHFLIIFAKIGFYTMKNVNKDDEYSIFKKTFLTVNVAFKLNIQELSISQRYKGNAEYLFLIYHEYKHKDIRKYT